MQSRLGRCSSSLLYSFHPHSSRSFSRRPPSSPVLQAIFRLKSGDGTAARYRDHGLIPAVVSDGIPSHSRCSSPQQTSSLLLFLNEREVSEFFQKMGHRPFMSTLFVMRICNHFKPRMEEFTQMVLPRTINFDDAGRITNVRFIKAVEGTKMKLNCPLVLIGVDECIGTRKGGVLKRYYSYLPLSCIPEKLPVALEVDVSKLDIGELIFAGDIQCNVDLHPDLDPAAPICEILAGV